MIASITRRYGAQEVGSLEVDPIEEKFLLSSYDTRSTSHLGETKKYELVAQKIWWPNQSKMSMDIASIVVVPRGYGVTQLQEGYYNRFLISEV
jgi:hypothetical protein